MRSAHSLEGLNLDLLRSFFAIVEHGSLSKAAVQLRVAQSTLTRQMHALEQEIGGRLLERSATGVALTASGRVFFNGMREPLARINSVIEETCRMARGQQTTLRIGYLASAARVYLNPALAVLRREHPEVKVKLLDLSPGEQIAGLRGGQLDVALLGSFSGLVVREFFVRRIATMPMLVGLPETHALAKQASVAVAELKGELFVDAPDRDLPGYHEWVVRLCRRAKFRPRFVQSAESLAHMLSTAIAEDAVVLLPDFATTGANPGLIFRPLRDAAKTDLTVAWQRGKLGGPLQVFLNALPKAKP